MIHPVQRNGLIGFLAVVFILLATAASLYAGGSREDSTLSRADELINQKEYDQAIQLLSDFIKDNPDRFSEAQERLQRIVRLREQFNRIANELLDVVENEPENSAKIFEMTNRLLDIELPTNPTTRMFLENIHLLAEFNVNRNRLETILANGRALLERNDFSGALDMYASGLDIYQSAYFSAAYGGEADAVALQGLELINGDIQRFKSLASTFIRAAQSFTSYCDSLGRTPAGVASSYATLVPHMNELHTLMKGFVETRESYDRQLAILQRDFNVVGDRSFLSFAGRLITGPAGQNEGMSGALDRFWHLWFDPAKTALINATGSSYRLGFTSMKNNDYSGAILTFNETSQYIATGLQLVRDWDSFLDIFDKESNFIYEEMLAASLTADYLELQAMSRNIALLREAGIIGNRGNDVQRRAVSVFPSWQQGRLEASTAITQEDAARTSYQGLIAGLQEIETELNGELSTIQSYQQSLANVPGGVGAPEIRFTDTQEIVRSMNANFQSLQFNSIVHMYTIMNGDLDKRVNDREREFEEGNNLIQGVSQQKDDGTYHIAYYPTEGLERLTSMSQSLGADIELARSYNSRYAGEALNLRTTTEITILYSAAQGYLARLLNLQTQSGPVMASARTQVDRATSLRFEGERLYQAAQAALNRGDTSGAYTILDQASRQYAAAFAIQEAPSAYDAWTSRSQRLGAEIVRVENENVVRDVRNYLTSAQNYYYAGNMDQAETALVNAQNRWRVTNVTDQPEVENWLTLVRAAMSIQSGSAISPTAPLFAEMSQLLSDANLHYNVGVRLLNSGQRDEGLVQFAEALEKAMEVRLIFPLNQEARLLELKIEQQRDIPVFNASFQQRLNEAVAGTKQQNAESFAVLLTLQAINPSYPNIQGIVYQAEIDMGYRPPPPDPANIARSSELTRNAQAVINSRDEFRYAAAEGWLAEAIRLNPSNTQAQTLMDQLNRMRGGDGIIVLPPDAQTQLDIATREYNQGNYLIASSIVERLLQNPQYRNSIQIQNLKRRLDAIGL